MKIIEDLWQVGGEGLTAPGDAAVYLVRFGHFENFDTAHQALASFKDREKMEGTVKRLKNN